MNRKIAARFGLCAFLLVSWPRGADADSVVTWNENAAKAAAAACLHISGNGSPSPACMPWCTSPFTTR